MAKLRTPMKKYQDEMEAEYNAIINKFGEDFLADGILSLMDRSYYANNPAKWKFRGNAVETPMQWVLIEKLPSEEFEGMDKYKPKERMQGLLNTLHGICSKVAFLLVRYESYTYLYMGVSADKFGTTAKNVLKTMMHIHFAGASFSAVEDDRLINGVLNSLKSCGVVTGQPSIKGGEKENPLQSLDRIAGGLRSMSRGNEKNYALLVVADAVSDTDTKELMQKMHQHKSDLNDFRKYSDSLNVTQSVSGSVNAGVSIGSGHLSKVAATAAGMPGAGGLTPQSGAHIGAQLSKSVSGSKSISREHFNYKVDYCINQMDKMVSRFEEGRSQGFWNAATYVLGEDDSIVEVVSAVVRSVYAGQDTHLEPLRCFCFGDNSAVHKYIKNMQLLPVPYDNSVAKALGETVADGESWHAFGHLYETVSTPVNTQELSVMMSLPRKDVAGLEIQKNVVEFATNPPEIPKNARYVELGDILCMGSKTLHKIKLMLDELNGHAALMGCNGVGKSVTSRVILMAMIEYGIPFLVIDPVKLDYVYWADEYNQKHKNDKNFKPIKIYAPGLESIPGVETPISKLKMNPFKPYVPKGVPLCLEKHISALMGLLRQTMAMGDFLPMLLNEAVSNYTARYFGAKIAESNAVDPGKIKSFPTFTGLMDQIDELLESRQYSEENTRNFKAALQTRINSLTSGWKRNFFESDESTLAEDLFEGNAIICLDGVVDNNDKAFLMALIMQAEEEYRRSRYTYDVEYRNTVKKGRDKYNGKYLAHYTVIEEAHRILKASQGPVSDADPQRVVADKFCEILSEIRDAGEGIMIIDQYPSRLISDAIKNTNVKFIHKLPARDDQEAIGACMSLDKDQTRLLATLKTGDAIVHSGQDDPAMWIHVAYTKDNC